MHGPNCEESPWSANILSGNARDLTWQRVRRWRYLIAELFDSSLCPNPKTGIEQISFTVSNEMNDVLSAKISPELYLLLGWIMDKLGWEFSDKQLTFSDKGFLGAFNDLNGNTIKLLIGKAKDRSSRIDPELGISSVNIVVRGASNQRYSMEIRRLPNCDFCEIETKSISGKQEHDFCEYSVRRVSFPKQSFAEIVLAEITAGARSRNFGPAYRMAYQLAEKLKF
jgi:hypothetical protein